MIFFERKQVSRKTIKLRNSRQLDKRKIGYFSLFINILQLRETPLWILKRGLALDTFRTEIFAIV